jgi:squalene cyclase
MKRTAGTVRIAAALLAGVTAAGGALAQGARPRLVTAKAEQAIHKGLQYLAKTQHKSGSWSGGGGYGSYEAAMTGLAGVALLSSGSTPTRGPYAPNIQRALHWVLSQQNRATGLICSRGEESRSMYGHGFCMLFLAESLGMTANTRLESRIRVALQKGVKLTEAAQSPLGGWIYTPTSRSDEGSVTVTQVQALRACQNAGVQVNKKLIERAFQYLQKAKCADGGIAYSARSRGSSRPAITAAALTCLFSAGKHDSPLAKSCLKYCLSRYKGMLGSGAQRYGHYYYTHLYLAEALYQHGGKTWEDYYPKIRDYLLTQQQPNGSWQGDSVGHVYGTSVALTILQLPYGYLPIVQK